MICPMCGKEIKDTQVCPICGSDLTKLKTGIPDAQVIIKNEPVIKDVSHTPQVEIAATKTSVEAPSHMSFEQLVSDNPDSPTKVSDKLIREVKAEEQASKDDAKANQHKQQIKIILILVIVIAIVIGLLRFYLISKA